MSDVCKEIIYRMEFLKFHDRIKALFLIAFLAFGFLGRVAFAEPTTEAECKASQGTDGYPGFCTLKSKGCGNGVAYGTCENANSDGTVGEDRVCCLTSSPTGNITNDVDCKAKNGTCEDGSQGKDSSKVINGDCGKNTKTGITQICCTSPTSDTSYSGTASLNYTPLENLPGFEGQSGDFATYFGNLYKLALWIVAISALFMLVVGGFLYLSSAGNTALLGTAKKVIYSALIGLVIALISWLLLDTINSDLTNLKLTGLTGAIGTSSGTSSSSTASPTSGSAAAVLSEAYKMVNNTSCNYSQAIPRNGCQGDPPHTDCSDFVVSAYKRAGCSVPPDGTSNMKAVAEDIGDKSSLKSGDAIVYNNGSHGHVVICENSGCSTYTAAASTKSGLVKGRDSAHVFSDGAAAGGLKVLRVSKYCKS